MNQAEVIDKMSSTGLIASCLPTNKISSINIIEATNKGGLRVSEMKHPREDRSFYVFKGVVEETKSLRKLVLGASGVADARVVEVYLKNGAQFIFTPFLNNEIAAVYREYWKLWIPGCANMQGVETAKGLGARVVKILQARKLNFSFFTAANDRFRDLYITRESVALKD